MKTLKTLDPFVKCFKRNENLNKRHYMRPSCYARCVGDSRGFSLVELAVVVVLIGMMMTFGIKLAGGLQDRTAFDTSRNKQTVIKNSLIAYLAQNGNLPCPYVVVAYTIPAGTEGAKNAATGVCTTPFGIVPFAELGLPRDTVIDGWGRFFSYEAWSDTNLATCPATVTNSGIWTFKYRFLNDPTAKLTYHDGEDGCLSIREYGLPNNNHGVAILISHGSNGFGGFTPIGSQIDSSAAAAEEKYNIVGLQPTPHTFSVQTVNNKGYDDLVMEISNNDLLQPLKNSGAITSLNQIASDYLMANLSIKCTSPSLTIFTSPAALVTLNPASASTATFSPVVVSFSSKANFPTFSVTATIDPSKYGCSTTGFTY